MPSMFSAAIAARAAHHIRQQRPGRTLRGLGQYDPTISPAVRLFIRYWWALPVSGVALYASYRARRKEGKGKQGGELVLDAVQVLSAVAGIIALLELESSKDAVSPVAQAAAAANVHGLGAFGLRPRPRQNIPDFPLAKRLTPESVVPFFET